ncbi:hypothetical protein GPALN_014784 [Globodera pallida]|nr:hypothetical protein GPALN_014784 [Globodera pallida]
MEKFRCNRIGCTSRIKHLRLHSIRQHNDIEFVRPNRPGQTVSLALSSEDDGEADVIVAKITRNSQKPNLSVQGNFVDNAMNAIEQKLAGAREQRITRVVVPHGNMNDVLELPADASAGMTIEYLDRPDQLWDLTL